MRKLFIYLQYPRVLAADLLYLSGRRINSHHGKTISQLLDEDMVKYNPHSSGLKKPGIPMLNFLLISKPIFRSNFYYRISDSEKLASSIKRAISLMLLKPYFNIEIGGEIDGGLCIVHNMGCVVAPYIAGKNLSIFQGGGNRLLVKAG